MSARTRTVFLTPRKYKIPLELHVFANVENELTLKIQNAETEEYEMIVLDYHTAIRLSKQLRIEISKIKNNEKEVNNG